SRPSPPRTSTTGASGASSQLSPDGAALRRVFGGTLQACHAEPTRRTPALTRWTAGADVHVPATSRPGSARGSASRRRLARVSRRSWQDPRNGPGGEPTGQGCVAGGRRQGQRRGGRPPRRETTAIAASASSVPATVPAVTPESETG